MGEFARESILHALVAAFLVSALTRTWRVEDPTVRVRLGMIAVAAPALFGPALSLAVPGRATDAFREGRALFDSARWNDIRVFGAGLADLVVVALSAIGLLLLLRDLVPWLQERFADRSARPVARSERVDAILEKVTARMGVTMPPIVVLDEDATVVQCAGVLRPSILVSRGACDALDQDELAAALAHEVAHLECRDPALGWALMGARVVLWFNPVLQVIARAVTQEVERRADEAAAGATGDRLALASALVKVFRATDGAWRPPRWPVPGLDTGGRTLTRFRAAALEARCRALLAPEPTRAMDVGGGGAQVLLAGAGVAVLLFFVV